MSSLGGQLLIASPELLDPNFRRSVVLIVQHTSDGALGLILNRPLRMRLDEAWRQVKHEPCPRDDALFWGGPCEGPLMALHADPERAEIAPLEGVHFAGQSEHLDQLVVDTHLRARFFVGYAGWSAGQLEQELQAGGWIVAPALADDVFHYEEDLWRLVLRRASGEAYRRLLGIDAGPPDLSVN